MPLLSMQLVISLTALSHHALAAFPNCVNGPLASNLVCNTSAPYLERAKALVAEFTLEELVNNTVNMSPGVERLGLPPYNWWSEALVCFIIYFHLLESL